MKTNMTAALGLALTILFAQLTNAADLSENKLQRLDINSSPDRSYQNVEVEQIKLGSKVSLFLTKMKVQQKGRPLSSLLQQWAFRSGEKIVSSTENGILTVNITSHFSKSDLRKRYFYNRGLEFPLIPQRNEWARETYWQNGMNLNFDREKPWCQVEEVIAFPIDANKDLNGEDPVDLPLEVGSIESSVSAKNNSLDIGLNLNQDQGYHITCMRRDSKRFTLGELEQIFERQIFFGDAISREDIPKTVAVGNAIGSVVKAKVKFLSQLQVGWDGRAFIQDGKILEGKQLTVNKPFCRIDRMSLNPLQLDISKGATVNASVAVWHHDAAPGMEMGSVVLVNSPDLSIWKRISGIFSFSSDEFIMSCSFPDNIQALRIQDLRQTTRGIISWE